ncbi:MAG TPA: hypothetical protein VH330_07975 [Candidatus Udaeobacter sp.]|jgi:hypothetical protein
MPGVVDTVAQSRRSLRHPWFSAFFAFGAMMCAVTAALLLFPGSRLDSLWRLNPHARPAFQALGSWSLVVMLTVGIACLFAAIGLWRGTFWGILLALIILSINIIGDTINAFFRHDYRALIGLPIGAAMILLLVRSDRRSKGFRAWPKQG